MIVQALQELGPADRDFEAVTTPGRERTQKIAGDDSSVIELADEDKTLYVIATGTHASHVDVRVTLTGSPSGLAVSTAQIQCCDHCEADSRVNRKSCRRVGARSLILVPLRHDAQTVGVLKLISWGEVFHADAQVVHFFHREVTAAGRDGIGGRYV